MLGIYGEWDLIAWSNNSTCKNKKKREEHVLNIKFCKRINILGLISTGWFYYQSNKKAKILKLQAIKREFESLIT